MESNSSGLSLTPVSDKELIRQFRVLDQTLSIHTILRDRYKTCALAIDIVLLGCAVIFTATTFARDDLFSQVGLLPEKVRYILGVASIIAFFASLVAILVDWKGKAARHQDAAEKLGAAMALFRKFRSDDGTWPQDRRGEIHQAYWEAMNNIIEIPSALFVSLKAQHLRKVQLSKMLDRRPGCPIFVLRFLILWQALKGADTKSE